MLYAWGAWLIFFCLREKNGDYIETQTTRKD
nr:MAG TPA: CCSMST1 family protein [Caudoviricetes sp.]